MMKDSEKSIGGSTLWIYENLYILLYRIPISKVDSFFCHCFYKNGWRDVIKMMKTIYVGDRASEGSFNGKKLSYEADAEYCSMRTIFMDEFRKAYPFTKIVEADFDTSLFITYLRLIKAVEINQLFSQGSHYKLTPWSLEDEHMEKKDEKIGKIFDVYTYSMPIGFVEVIGTKF